MIYLQTERGPEDDLRTRVESLWTTFLLEHKLDLSACALRIGKLEDENWATAWRHFFHPLKIGQRLWISPSWEPASPAEGELALEIDPGLAFGTGGHESTSLLLESLDELAGKSPLPEPILDVGTGSGILGIAACKLGVGLVEGFDNDPMAVEVASENRRRNAIPSESFHITRRGIDSFITPRPLVMANIISSILISLSTDLVRLTAAGGRLWLSGILFEEREELREHFEGLGLTFESDRRDGEWICLHFRK